MRVGSYYNATVDVSKELSTVFHLHSKVEILIMNQYNWIFGIKNVLKKTRSPYCPFALMRIKEASRKPIIFLKISECRTYGENIISDKLIKSLHGGSHHISSVVSAGRRFELNHLLVNRLETLLSQAPVFGIQLGCLRWTQQNHQFYTKPYVELFSNHPEMLISCTADTWGFFLLEQNIFFI